MIFTPLTPKRVRVSRAQGRGSVPGPWVRPGYGLIVKLAFCDVELSDAEIVAVVEVEGEVVDTVNLAVVDPAATVTIAGTVAYPLLDDRVIVNPPVGAAPLMVTVPVDDPPLVTDVGDKLKPVTVLGACTVT